jgi:hypothetical protein
MSLTATAVRVAKPTNKLRKLHDSRGLYLLIMPNGSRLWRFKYRFGGKENLLSLGAYPEISLGDARSQRDELRLQIAKGINPGAARQAEKAVLGRINKIAQRTMTMMSARVTNAKKLSLSFS